MKRNCRTYRDSPDSVLMRGIRICAWFFIATNHAVADPTVDYQRQIKPIFKERCYACHGVLKQEAGLRLDTAVLAIKGSKDGPVIVPADPIKSGLLRRITSKDDGDRMPPEGEPLKPEEIAVIKSWVEQGAKGPVDEVPERDPKDHWSFQTPVRPLVPTSANTAWSLNPIDAFLAASHANHGLIPQPAADKRIWLRRVTLDLIGLPPTQEEMDEFLTDDSSGAIDKVVNRLLDSPHYGERWGRHWMDIWRYSDWWGLGDESRNSQRHIYHWRDWIIESLNADKGYDQMLREMLAADELYPEDQNRLRAGGFLGRQYFKFNRTSWMDETVEHTAKAMLGLTFNCAKCHDHKYDPFAQTDYYRFRAFFEPYQVRHDVIDGEIDFTKDGLPRPFDCNLDTKTYLHIRGDDRNPDTSKVMEPGFPSFLSHVNPKIEIVSLPTLAIQPGLRPDVVAQYLKRAEQQIVAKRAELERARVEVEAAKQRTASAEQLAKSPLEQRLTNDGKTIVADNFAAANPALWEPREGNWEFVDGKLKQTKQGDTQTELRLKQVPPADFEARLKYVVTGGKTWKSVGITFDGHDANESLVYVSAHATGAKAQVAYKKGHYVYPAEAMKALPIVENQPYLLVVRVRGPLVNLSVDGEHAVAFTLPNGRQNGVLQIITYDAQAEIRSFELKELSPTMRLVEVPGATTEVAPLTLEQAELSASIAEKALAWAELQPDSIRTRTTAEHARFEHPQPANFGELARNAARAERVAAAAKAEEESLRAELNVLRAGAEKKADAEGKLKTARTTLEAARKAIYEPSESYTPVRGALKVLESNLETEESRFKPFPITSTGRRTALAQWVTHPKNPLTPRVAVNHIWMRHFGRPLVPTVFDFGRKGTAATHPELLDWLAVELVEGGSGEHRSPAWSMKHLHQLIVTSNAYRMTSSSVGASSDNLRLDQENRFYWRMNPIRMESQIVRDTLLALAGELDLTMGGPPIPIANEMSRRRSLYFFHSNIQREKFLSTFDDASVLDCYRRAESVVPQQALALENSAVASEMAVKIAQKIDKFAPEVLRPESTDVDFIRTAFRTVLVVDPTDRELAASAEALNKLAEAAQKANRQDAKMQARIALILALLNHNDFVTVR